MGCSLVELIAEDVEMQKPRWFVSHAWLEPITLFVPWVLFLGWLTWRGIAPTIHACLLFGSFNAKVFFGRQNHRNSRDVFKILILQGFAVVLGHNAR